MIKPSSIIVIELDFRSFVICKCLAIINYLPQPSPVANNHSFARQ